MIRTKISYIVLISVIQLLTIASLVNNIFLRKSYSNVLGSTISNINGEKKSMIKVDSPYLKHYYELPASQVITDTR